MCNWICLIRSSLLVLFLATSFSIFSNPIIGFDYFNEAHGIDNASIEAITQDSEGYIWLGTHAGLYQFDGRKAVKYYSDGQPGSLLGDDIYDLLWTDENTLWIATSTAGVARFDKRTKTFTHITDTSYPHRLSHYRVRDLVFHNDEIWVMTGRGVNVLLLGAEGVVNVKEKKISNKFPSESFGNLLLFDNYIYAVIDGNFFRIKGVEEMFEQVMFTEYEVGEYLKSDLHYSVFGGDEKSFYIYTEKGLFNIDSSLRRISKLPFEMKGVKKENYEIRTIVLDSLGTIWIGTYGHGLYSKAKSEQIFKKISTGVARHQLNSEYFYIIFEDSAGNLWMGSDGIHLVKFSNPDSIFPFFSNMFDQDIENQSYSIWSFAEFGGRILLGTDRGIYRLTGTNGYHELTPFLVGNNFQESFSLLVADEELLIGSSNGLYKYNSNGEIVNLTGVITEALGGGYKNEPVVTQLVKSDCCIIVGTYYGLVIVNDNLEIKNVYNEDSIKNKLNDDFVTVLEFNRLNETIWISGSFGGQTVSLNNDQKSLLLLKETNQMLDRIESIINDYYFDKSGDVWIATDDGLYRYTSNKQLVHYNYFPESSIKSIEVVNDLLWMGTEKGIIRANINSLSNFKYFIHSDGVYNSLNLQKSSYYSVKNDYLYFGGDKGVLRFKSSFVIDDPVNVSPKLHSITYFDGSSELDVTEKLVNLKFLPHDENNLEFDFVLLDYKAPELNRFQYKLEGFDQGWSKKSSRNTVSYTNLPSGKYVFRVKAYDANHNLSPKELYIPFEIKPAWWYSKIAFLLYFLVFVAALYWFWKSYRQKTEKAKLRQIQKNKEEFLSDFNQYAFSLTKMHSYQTLIRLFLDRVMLLTGAEYIRYQQVIFDTSLEISVGQYHLVGHSELYKEEIVVEGSIAQLYFAKEMRNTVTKLRPDIYILYQQMIILQSAQLDRQKFNRIDYIDSTTGHYNFQIFCNIIQDEYTRSIDKGFDLSLIEWRIDKRRFRDNDLLKKIQLMSNGDQIKYVFGQHVIAALIINSSEEYNFLIYPGEQNRDILELQLNNLRKIINENNIAEKESLGVLNESVIVKSITELKGTLLIMD